MQLITRATLAVALVAGGAAPALAFEAGAQFDTDPSKGDGGGGIAFDGAPRWSNHDCSVCHTGAQHRIGVNLLADQPTLFTDGWAPSKQYHLRVELTHEGAGLQYNVNSATCGNTDPMSGPYTPCNNNGFALEIDDGLGKPIGKFAAVIGNACSTTAIGGTVNILKDGSAVLHNGATPGGTKWDFCWTSPAAGAGTVTAYVAVVDGNGGTGNAKFTADTIGDDVATGSVPLFEAAFGQDVQNGGCDAGGGASALVGVGLVIALVVLRRRRAPRTLAIATLATAMLGGCTHVRPHQREVLARDNMKFGPDPAEDELDLHMQESREGSSGGYGSSGGGCGCN